MSFNVNNTGARLGLRPLVLNLLQSEACQTIQSSITAKKHTLQVEQPFLIMF